MPTRMLGGRFKPGITNARNPMSMACANSSMFLVYSGTVPYSAPAVRDGPVVTAASPRGEALHEAAALLCDALLDYRIRSKQSGTPPRLPLIGDGGTRASS